MSEGRALTWDWIAPRARSPSLSLPAQVPVSETEPRLAKVPLRIETRRCLRALVRPSVPLSSGRGKGLSSVLFPAFLYLPGFLASPRVCPSLPNLWGLLSVHPSPPPKFPRPPLPTPRPSVLHLPRAPSPRPHPTSGRPLDPILLERRLQPTLAVACLSGRLSFSSAGVRPGCPPGLASRPWDPARPSPRGASFLLSPFRL